jgi:hypothetical protein
MRTALAGLILFVLAWSPTVANDTAASTAAGGIQLRREPRIAMIKEKLFISLEKVTVEYEFLNESDTDIATEVAFPVPAYGIDYSAAGTRDFDDFKVWADGTELKYAIEARARLGGRDYTAILKRFSIDVASLGHFNGRDDFSADFRKLAKSQQDTLTDAGLFDRDNEFPQWQVEKIYHWQQTFPAHRLVHVRHEYKPGIGFTQVDAKFFNSRERAAEVALARQQSGSRWVVDDALQIDNACVDSQLERTLAGPDKPPVEMFWVDYILSTANGWKTPIRDFQLEIEKLQPQGAKSYVSFCWDGPVQRVAPNRFRANVKNFIPTRELHVVFFEPLQHQGSK